LVAPPHTESARYLQTKVLRMGHQIDLAMGSTSGNGSHNGDATFYPDPVGEIAGGCSGFSERHGRPFITLCYAQSLDGCLSSSPGKPFALSGIETLTLAHRLRASHDGVMVGIGTVLSDNPRLTVRYGPGQNPQPIVVDSRLRVPLDCNLVREPRRSLWVASVEGCSPERRREIEAARATVLGVSGTCDGRVDLAELMSRLSELGMRSIVVEGGVQVIRSLMAARLVDYLVVTVAPRFIGGEHEVRLQTELLAGPAMRSFHHLKLGGDLVLWGEPAWPA
jgi:3,4-dihydroxy 2-butanone 4-phosphate synthase/GTP cyclohydrolase II